MCPKTRLLDVNKKEGRTMFGIVLSAMMGPIVSGKVLVKVVTITNATIV
jgi:hypothetical protein